MNDETRRVLDLLAQGKITVDEAGELLSAMREAANRSSSDAQARPDSPLRYIRIEVRKKGGAADGDQAACSWPGFTGAVKPGAKEVNIRVPISFVRSGMRLGAVLPGIANDVIVQALRDRGINANLSRLDPEQLDALLKNMGEITVDVDQGRKQVRISAE